MKIINSAPKNTNDGLMFYQQAITHVFQHLRIPFEPETPLHKTYVSFLKKAEDRIRQFQLPYSCDDLNAYFKERDGVVINTIHGIKGEEYAVVIGYDLLNGHLPNWNIINNKNETLKLLYVLCSRAKSALYLFSETGRTTRTGHPLTSTNELYNVRYHYDGSLPNFV